MPNETRTITAANGTPMEIESRILLLIDGRLEEVSEERAAAIAAWHSEHDEPDTVKPRNFEEGLMMEMARRRDDPEFGGVL